MGKLYVPGGSGATANLTPYVEVNGLTKKVKKIYCEDNGVTVLVYPSEVVDGTYLQHFQLGSSTSSFGVILQQLEKEKSYLYKFKVDSQARDFNVVYEG